MNLLTGYIGGISESRAARPGRAWRWAGLAVAALAIALLFLSPRPAPAPAAVAGLAERPSRPAVPTAVSGALLAGGLMLALQGGKRRPRSDEPLPLMLFGKRWEDR